jgi:hypothetical protein
MPLIWALRRMTTSADALNICVDFAARSHHQVIGNAWASALFFRIGMAGILRAAD